ncbi:hypothetical protein BDY24DRAFT_102179 [Mrakia frigida]|uniref:uncharacterized protein n=1 Tax=Mrakia frigida TaxID=29902 RepID=UPI003FCBFF62
MGSSSSNSFPFLLNRANEQVRSILETRHEENDPSLVPSQTLQKALVRFLPSSLSQPPPPRPSPSYWATSLSLSSFEKELVQLLFLQEALRSTPSTLLASSSRLPLPRCLLQHRLETGINSLLAFDPFSTLCSNILFDSVRSPFQPPPSNIAKLGTL